MDQKKLQSTIESTRRARDNSARAAAVARKLAIPTLGDQLDELAAAYDKLLADLLALSWDWD